MAPGCSRPRRKAPIGWNAICLVVGFRETGKRRGAILVSLPPVAVVTASAARDIRGSVRVVVVGG